jgi:myosin-5
MVIECVLKIRDIFKICAAVLQIGNINITGSRDEASISEADVALSNACQLLGVDKTAFRKWILKKQIVTRSEKITTALNTTQALVARDSLAKFLYSVLFDYLVKTINSKLIDGKSDKNTELFIGVLDIYGFEHFKTNSFEQFCIVRTKI